jgi:hypothetical protein
MTVIAFKGSILEQFLLIDAHVLLRKRTHVRVDAPLLLKLGQCLQRREEPGHGTTVVMMPVESLTEDGEGNIQIVQRVELC